MQVWSPKAQTYKWIAHGPLKKWAGYVDQYILFPLWVRTKVARQTDDTLYVFCDQALGPWVPLVKHLPHVVHTHDLLALRSALGEVPENRTSWTGKIYQRYIRQGFRQARHFISISNKTRDDLHHYGKVDPWTSEVVYNGLNYPFAPLPIEVATGVLDQSGIEVPAQGFLLHVSGGQWYKNLPGVIRLYAAYARLAAAPLTLWCVCPDSAADVRQALREVPPTGRVVFFQSLSSEALVAAYSLARVFVLPSLAEGFGWPIIEAQACGCPVLTTDEPPMNEIGGPAASYIPRLRPTDDMHQWAAAAAFKLQSLIDLQPEQRNQLVAQGIQHASRFTAEAAISGYLQVYERVMASQESLAAHRPLVTNKQKVT